MMPDESSPVFRTSITTRSLSFWSASNSVIFMEDNYEKKYDGFDPNNPESVISLLLMQEEYLEQSILAATSIQNSFVTILKRKDRTVKQAGFLVLRNTYMPSVLIETGFLTNKNEGTFLNSYKGQNSIAKAISKAIIDYKNNINKSIEEINVYDNNNESKSNQNTTKGLISYKVQISASKNKITTSRVQEIVKFGEVNFSKSNTKLDSCNIYIIETKIDQINYSVELENCKNEVKIISYTLE